MEVLPFTPNYLKNKGVNFDKIRHEARPEPTKKRTEIKDAIKTVEEVPEKIAEVVKKKRGRHRKNI